MKNVLILSVLSFFWCAHASAEEVRRLTPAQAAALALVANPALRAARDAKTAAAAERLAARILPNPSLSAAHDRVVGSTRDLRSDAYSVGLDFEISRLLLLGPNLRAADAKYAAAGLDVAWEEFQTANAARLEVIKLALASEALQVASTAEKNLAVNAAQIRAAGTSETELDLAAADAAASEATVNRLAQEQALADERVALNAALGLPPLEKISPDAESALAALRAQPLPAFDEVTATLEKRRPDLLALQMGRNSQDAKLRAAILGRFPAVTLGVQQARDTGNIETRGVTVTFSLPVFDRNQGAVAAEQATRQQLADEYTSRVAAAHSDVVKALADVRWIRLQLAATGKALAARQRLAAALEKNFREGGVEAAILYTARTDVTTSRSDLLKLETALAEAAAALALATGTDIFATP